MLESAVTITYRERTGAADRIFSLLRRRGFPLSGLTLERTHHEGIGRMSVSVTRQESVEQVVRHLERLPDVISARAVGEPHTVRREYALVRVRCAPEQRSELMALLAAFDARAVTMTSGYLVVEASGTGDAIDLLFGELEPYGIEESARTHPIALGRVGPGAYQTTA
jgi:acetolactate synthase-1/3 small subunit